VLISNRLADSAVETSGSHSGLSGAGERVDKREICLDFPEEECHPWVCGREIFWEEAMTEPRLDAVALWVLVMLLLALTLVLELAIFEK
jgi:hypothetical protein